MYTATAEAQLKIILNELENTYKQKMELFMQGTESMRSNVLEGKHLHEKQKIINSFNQKKIMGNAEIKIEYKQLLQEKLENELLKYRKINRVKQEAGKREHELKRELEKAKLEQDIERMKQQQKHQQELQKIDEELHRERLRREEQQTFNGLILGASIIGSVSGLIISMLGGRGPRGPRALPDPYESD